MGRKGSDMDNTKVRVENVTKVFETSAKSPFLIKEGKSKSEILKETGMNVGVKKQRLKFTLERFSLLWVCLVAGNLR